MRYVVFAVPEEFAADRVVLVPTDPRDGPVEAHRVADGTAIHAALRLLGRCTLAELYDLQLVELRKVQRAVAAEERAARLLARQAKPDAVATGVIGAADIQREFDKAVVEEQLEGGGS